MATKTAQKNASNTILRSLPSRQAITLELVAAHAPSHALVGRLCSTFGLDPVDYDGIREATKDQIGLSTQALQPTVNETAMKIHLQRVVGSFVSSAHGAAQFYGGKVTQARDLRLRVRWSGRGSRDPRLASPPRSSTALDTGGGSPAAPPSLAASENQAGRR
jgi:hypothetical protein